MFWFRRKLRYNKKGYFIKNEKNLKKQSEIAVVTPVYNAGEFLSKTIDSVINQSVGFEKIQFILVDDGSKDTSRDILMDYANKYSNITIVYLKKNTGSPAGPRNLGIELSNSKYITFLDADDWLAEDGLKTLYDILEETNDDYVVGKTIQVETKLTRIVGKWESCLERRSVDPFSVENIFKHLGPRARMMKSSIVKDNNIRFPHMKFSEDKQFFMDVLINCKAISTTKKIIYYLNRLDENDASLVTQTDAMMKMDTNIAVIKYIKAKKLDVEKEKIILNRLYEFDCVTRLFNRVHFLKSEKKDQYYKKYKEIADTAKDLSYDFRDNFEMSINKVVARLYEAGKYDAIPEVIKYNRMVDNNKKTYEVIDNKPYLVANFLDDEFKYMPIKMLAQLKDCHLEDNKYIIKVSVVGDYISKLEKLVVEKRESFYDEKNYHYFDITNDNGDVTISLDIDKIKEFESGKYKMYLIYGGYHELSIMNKNIALEKENSNVWLYNTIYANLAMVVKK